MEGYHIPWGRKTRLILCFCFLAVFLVSIITSEGLAQSEAALLYLRISPYARANGMGQAFVALSDQESPYYNPAGLGLFALDHYGSLTFFPVKINWLPAFASDIRLNLWAVNVGYNLRNTEYRLPVSIGFGYYHINMDYGEHVRTSEIGEILGTYKSYDRANNFVLSLGFDALVDAGVGLTYKYLDSTRAPWGELEKRSLVDEATYAFDIGAIMRIPVVDLLQLQEISSSEFGFHFDPSVGICWSNIGPGISYGKTIFSYKEKDPLPKTCIYGAALETGLSYQSHGVHWNLFSLTGTYQWDKDLVGEEGAIIKKRGFELVLTDLFSLRAGGWKDKYFNTGENKWVPTYGLSFSLRGLLKSFLILGSRDSGYDARRDNGLIDFLAKHFDIRYDWATYDADDSPLADFRCSSISIVF